MSSVLTVAVLLALVLMPTRSAHAQGTADMLPKPIDTGELVRYMERLELSDQQQMAVTSMHDEYKAWYRALYDDGMEEFLDELRGMSGFSMPTRDEMDDMISGLRRYESRIRALDNRLFDRMQTVLTDEQLAVLPRVRMARERETYSNQQMLQMWTMGSPIVDVSMAVRELELPEQTMAAIDPLLARYESNLTRRMKSLSEAATELWTDIYDALEAEGFNADSMEEMAMEDPEQMRKFMEVMQNIFIELTAKGREDVADLRDMNRRTLRSFEGLITPTERRMITYAYYNRAYPNIPAMTAQVPLGVEVLDGIDGLQAETKEQAAQAIRTALNDLDSIVSDAVERTDAFRQSFNFMDFDQEVMNAHQEAMSSLQARARSVAENLSTQLDSILSEEHRQQLSQRVAASWQRLSPSGMTDLVRARAAAEAAAAEAEAEDGAEGAETEREADAPPVYRQYSDQFLPGPIGRQDVTVYCRLIDVDESTRPIVNELHKSYEQRFSELEQQTLSKVSEAQQDVWSNPGEQIDAAAARANIDELYKRRREAMEAIARVDDQFFDDLKLVLGEDAGSTKLVDRVRKLRERDRLSRDGGGWYGYMPGGQNREATIDVIALTARQRLDSQTLQSLDEAFTKYEAEATPLLQQRYEASLDAQKQQELWGLRWRELQQEEGGATASAMTMSEYNERTNAIHERLNSATEQLALLNRKTFDVLLGVLSTEQTREMRELYNRRAFPEAYSDSESATQFIGKAMELPNLTDAQRTSLADMRAEYQPKYEDLRMKMIELMRNAPQRHVNFTDSDPTRLRELQQYQDNLSRLQFERQELDSRAVLRLKQILDDQQINRIGGLPELSEREGEPVFW